MNRSTAFLFLFIPVVFFAISSCTSNEIGKGKDVNPETIYFDYKVWGDETDDAMTVMLQYRFAGKNGTTLVLDDPAKVELDGKLISVDSSKWSGAFYEVRIPMKDFEGKHNIVFTDLNNKEYKEEFDFKPIHLLTVIPSEIKRGDIILHVDGLDPVDYVRVLLTDTSFASEDINEIDTVKNGQVIISEADLAKVFDGAVHLELAKETELPVKNGTAEGGRISFSYGLKRDFVLKK